MSTPITCLQCGGLLGPGDRFCAECGGELLWCAACGEFLLQSEETCPKCGTPGIPRPESRTVPFDLAQEDSPWADVIARLRRATLGEFEIGHELGRGGMAAVFLAHELSLHRDVAIKVMSPGLLMGDGMLERFRREAITIAHLNHPNIVSVYSVRAAEGLHFFVMRCIQGRSLEQIIKEAGKLSVPIVRSILHQVGSALAYAHRYKVVHRDIKPANILIDEDGNAVVTDFGIAKAAEGPNHTHTGFMVGTPAYMSPEQCSGGEVSGASDQYSLGAVAYEMITGVPPFTGSVYSVIQAHVERPPRPLMEQCDGCPPELESAILRMLAKDPAERWPGMAQAMAALGAAALAEDDPHRAELSRLAGAGAQGVSGEPSSQRSRIKTSTGLNGTPPGLVRAITILPPPPGLEVGDSFLLVARVHDGQGARLPGRSVEWSSDAPGILRVNPSKAVATAITPGTALIRALCDGTEGRLRVTVASPRADAIVVKSLEKPITIGDKVQLEATPRDKRGRVVTRPVTWRSDNDAVAMISPDGELVARSVGSTRIIAELDEARANVAVTVLPPAVAALHISPPPESVMAGDSFALTATPLDRWAGPLTGRTIAWSVSDVNVAMVTAGGWVITRNPGLVLLTATCEGVVASVSVSVLAQAAVPSTPELQGESRWAAPRPEPESWEVQPDARQPQPRRRSRSRPRWLVAAGGALVAAAGFWLLSGGRTVDSRLSDTTGLATRNPSPTESTFSAKADSDTVGFAAPIDSSRPASLLIARRPARPLVVGSSTTLASELRDMAGRILPGTGVAWSTSDSAVVAIDPRTGALRAKAPGRAEVVAASGDLADSTRILVNPRGSESPGGGATPPVSLSIASHGPLRAGDTATLSITALNSKGQPTRAPRAAWRSSDPRVAEIDPVSGKVHTHMPGSALIIAQSGAESAITSLSVLPAAVATVRIDGAQPLKIGDTVALQATTRDEHGEVLGERPVVWASNDPSVAEVDSALGLLVARAAGSAEITATSEGKAGRVRVTVLPQPLTARAEPAADNVQPTAEVRPDAALLQRRMLEQMVAGVEQCYEALRQKDVARLEALYNAATKSDLDKLKKLRRILETDEWEAEVGARQDKAHRMENDTTTMDFTFRLTWKDAFGGRLTSHPLFRADFNRSGSQLSLSSCRIIGSPKL
jgi:uncharacterized protein YjdB